MPIPSRSRNSSRFSFSEQGDAENLELTDTSSRHSHNQLPRISVAPSNQLPNAQFYEDEEQRLLAEPGQGQLQANHQIYDSSPHLTWNDDPVHRPSGLNPSVAGEAIPESRVTEDWARRQSTITANRRAATRRVKLVQGSVFSLNYPIPSAIQNAFEDKYKSAAQEEEFAYMRYTAATCDPNDFTMKNGYTLRPVMYNRHTELMVVVTYYNEDKFLFTRTFHSIMQNVRQILDKKSDFWNVAGPFYEKLVVCVVMDGLDPCDKDVLDILATIGLYQDGVMKKDVNGVETVAHIFEYTTQLSINDSQQLIRPMPTAEAGNLPPVQMMLCLKQKNSKKLNSHRWAFHAFGRLLNPEVVICLDAGTKPESGALRILWEQFYNDKDLGGCCGETKAMLSHGCGYVFRPLIAAQNFEYKISYILDKPMESAFGYVTVLPGAFSAYRFRAIIGRPLEEYFRGDHTLPKRAPAPSTIGGFVRNMFLAEDRILSFEVIVKAGSRWHTRYVTAAKANTDIPEGMIEFIDQRRRWLNGAFAVTVYTIANVWRIHKSGHNLKRMVLFYFQMIFTVVSLVLSWFSLAGFLLTTFIITDITGKPPADSTVRPFPFGKATNIFNAVVQSMYSVTVVLQFFLSMGSQARGNFWSYATSFVIFGVIQFYFILNALYLVIRIFKEGAFDGTASNYGYIQTFYSAIGTPTVLVTFISVFGVYYVASFLYLDPWHMFFSYPQYLFVASSYTNILNVYAFSKWNDIRWGEKRGQTPETPQVENVLPSAPLLRPTPGNTSISGPFFEEADKPQADIDDAFEEVVKRALRPYVKDKKMDKKPTEEELHAIFRTRLVAAYMFSNFLLCIFIMNDSFDSLGFLGDSFEHKVWFFRIFMWGTSITFLIRFFGSCAFLVLGPGRYFLRYVVWRLISPT